jgi:hypothetical protein
MEGVKHGRMKTNICNIRKIITSATWWRPFHFCGFACLFQ